MTKGRLYTTADKIVLVLTALLYSCFCIMNTDPLWSSLSLLIITFLVAIVLCFRCKRLSLFFTHFQKNILIFASYCFISTIWAINPADAIERGTTIIELCICMTVFMWAYSKIYDPLNSLLNTIMYGGYIVVIYTFVFFGIDKIVYMVSVGDRMDSTFDNVNTIGLICAISLILSLYFWYKKKNMILLLLDVPTVLLLSACGSRKALLVTILGCYAIYVLHKQVKNKLYIIVRSLFSFFILILLLQLLSQLPMFAGIAGRMEGLIAMVTGNGEIDHSAQVREDMVNLGLTLFKENPILGIGMSNAHIYTLKYIGHDCYLHNNYAELLADGGVIGTMLYYTIHCDIVYRLKKYRAMYSREGVVVLILMFCLLVSDLSVVSFYSKLYYFFFMVFYVYIYQLAEKWKKYY